MENELLSNCLGFSIILGLIFIVGTVAARWKKPKPADPIKMLDGFEALLGDLVKRLDAEEEKKNGNRL